jgi:hypothetical protein
MKKQLEKLLKELSTINCIEGSLTFNVTIIAETQLDFADKCEDFMNDIDYPSELEKGGHSFSNEKFEVVILFNHEMLNEN